MNNTEDTNAIVQNFVSYSFLNLFNNCRLLICTAYSKRNGKGADYLIHLHIFEYLTSVETHIGIYSFYPLDMIEAFKTKKNILHNDTHGKDCLYVRIHAMELNSLLTGTNQTYQQHCIDQLGLYVFITCPFHEVWVLL